MSVLKTNEFVAELATELGMTKTDARIIYDAFTNTMERVITEKQAGVKLGKVGSIKVEVQSAREYRNMQDPEGEKIQKPAQYKTKYTPSKSLKTALKTIEVK